MWEISIIGMSQIIFGIILISSKKKTKSDFILICWLIILSLPFLQSILFISDISLPILSKVFNQSFTLLHGPLLYLYLKELTKKEDDKIKYWPHFMIFALFYIIFIFDRAPLHPGGPLTNVDSGFSLLKHFGLINAVIFIVYGTLSLQSLYSHRKSLKETFAYESGSITLFWINFLPLLFVFLIMSVLIIENTSLNATVDIDEVHLTLFLFFALYLIFFGLRQKQVYPDKVPELEIEIEDEIIEEITEEKSPSNSENQHLLDKIDEVMERDKLYLNPVLSVYDLADSVHVSRHKISQLLNNDLSMNFYQYVNQYRLKEVCRRLEEDVDNKYNILDHAFDSGFNSKSSFNNLFKTHYGQTPSQYRKSIKRPN